jgi:tight adherence protein B
MGSTLMPAAIALGAMAATACLIAAVWNRVAPRLHLVGNVFARDLEMTDVHLRSEEFGYAVAGVAGIAWLALVALGRPSLLAGALELPFVAGLSLYAAKLFVSVSRARRTRRFEAQLESVLRSLVSGLRVGLGLRQAVVYLSGQVEDPARKEFARVVGATNLGVSILEALDELATRMPTAETKMMARVIRAQAQAGGDLGGVLENLAGTIRDRRQIDRKIRALTAQGRATAWVVGALPLALGAFVLTTQPALRDATLTTMIGHLTLVFGIGLDAAAIVALAKIVRVDV